MRIDEKREGQQWGGMRLRLGLKVGRRKTRMSARRHSLHTQVANGTGWGGYKYRQSGNGMEDGDGEDNSEASKRWIEPTNLRP